MCSWILASPFAQSVAAFNLLFLFFRFCGLTRKQQAGAETICQSKAPNWVYRYDIRPGKWMQILQEGENRDGRMVEEPTPRYAHQVVYDTKTKTVFMHGGNAGIGVGGMERREMSSSTGSGMDGEEGEDG